jgi:hypothetical protein
MQRCDADRGIRSHGYSPFRASPQNFLLASDACWLAHPSEGRYDPVRSLPGTAESLRPTLTSSERTAPCPSSASREPPAILHCKNSVSEWRPHGNQEPSFTHRRVDIAYMTCWSVQTDFLPAAIPRTGYRLCSSRSLSCCLSSKFALTSRNLQEERRFRQPTSQTGP